MRGKEAFLRMSEKLLPRIYNGKQQEDVEIDLGEII